MIVRIGFLCLLPLCAQADPQGALRIAGTEQTVFDWAHDRCATWDIPDAPARAWRDARGKVHLLAGSEATRAAAGTDLDHLTRDCRVLHRGAGIDDPAQWNDRTWIAAIHTADGKTLTALGHMEYHGYLRPETCPSQRYSSCWFNAVIELGSTDGGRTFTRRGGGADLVAALPRPYAGEAGRRMGYFNPSNIVEYQGQLHAFVFAEAAGPQQRGPCLIRRPVDGGAGDWRAWDGTDFATRFVDPHAEPGARPDDHACQPVPGLRSTVSSVVRHASSGLFLAVTPMTSADGATGIFWSSSADLRVWSVPQLLYEVPLLWRRDCADGAAYAYPSLIDPDSPSPSFDTADDRFWLYLTRMPLDDACAVTPERDLVRVPVEWHAAAPPR